jgi:outer membrane receptor protein involved in Fe transport
MLRGWLVAAMVCGVAAAPAARAEDLEIGEESSGPVNIASALAGTSGVRVQTMCTNCNVASVTMLGQSGEAVRVIKDGLPVLGGLGAIYLLSVMPADALAKTEILRGPATVLSGSQAGVGAVVLKTRDPADQRDTLLSSSGDVGSLEWFSQEAFVSGREGALGGQLAVTQSRSDGSDPNGDGAFDIASFTRTTVGGTASYQISDCSRLRFDTVFYREDQEDGKGGYRGGADPIDIGDFYREDIEIDRDEFGAAWTYDFRDFSRLLVRARFSSRDQDTSDDSTGVQKQYMTIDERADQAEVRYERSLFDYHLLTVGASYSDFEVDGLTTKSNPLFPDGQRVLDRLLHSSAYAEVSWSLPHRLDLTTGLRWDDIDHEVLDPQFGVTPENTDDFGSKLLPRFRLGWKATDTLGLSLSAGSAFAAPRPVFERVCCGALVLSNANARAEESFNVIFDADWVPQPWLQLRATWFDRDVDDYVQKYVWFSFPNYIPSYQMVNYDNVQIEGWEIGAELRLLDARLTLGVTATSLDATHDQPLEVRALGELLYTVPAGDVPYIAGESGSAFVRWEDVARGLELSFEADYTGSMLIQKLDSFFGPVDELEPTPSFWIYNARVRKSLTRNISVFAGVDNISGEFETWLGDPRYEFNWGSLRGRYVYGGLSYEM